MRRYKLTGSGVGYFSPELIIEVARKYGAVRPRAAFHFGWSNKPKTIRFSANDFYEAEKIGEQILDDLFAEYKRINKTSLCPMLRAYPLDGNFGY